MARRFLTIAVLTGLVACSVAPTTDQHSGSPSVSSQAPTAALPGPDDELPNDSSEVAARLTSTTRGLRAAIRRWRSSPDATTVWPPPEDVVLFALDQQRIYQVLAGSPKGFRRAATGELARSLRKSARATALAGARLASGSGKVTRTPELDTAAPLPADVLRSYFEEAESRFGVDWELLAAINFIETRFGRVVSKSSAGAQGPMQFIPSTWKAYGLGGDVHEPHDAILGAANYLVAAGAPKDERRALLAYNPVDAYADAVHLYAQQMRRDEVLYYAFYNWQVFVRTASGEAQRLTGPGL